MRITNSMMASSSLSRLQANLRSIAEVQGRIASGLRIERSSDDPSGASVVMQASTSLRALEQYRRNASAAVSRLGAEESAISGLGDLLTRAKELAVSQGSDTANAGTRTSTAAEVRQLRDAAIALGNREFAGSYLFGGDYADARPFDGTQPLPFTAIDPVTLLPREPVGRRGVEIGAGQYLEGTRDGKQVFLDSRAFEALQSLLDGLTTNDADGIRASLGTIDAAIDSVQAQLGDVGARANQLDATTASLDVLQDNFTTLKSDLAEVDIEQAFTELVSRQTAYQAAMLATSRISGMSLAEYLR
jgi:flagellar hook-associated protein 3 FlgL